MGLLRRSSRKNKEDSVFGRLGKTQISYSLEAEQKQENDDSTALVDNLPLLNLDSSQLLISKKSKKKERQDSKNLSVVKSPSGKFKVGKGMKNNPQSNDKKKIRSLFSKGSSSKNQKALSRHASDTEDLTSLSVSRDTEDHSDNEGQLIIKPLPLATSGLSLFALSESSSPSPNLFGAFDLISEEGESRFFDSFEMLMATTVSHVHTTNKDPKQADLIKFISETKADALDELIELESSRCKPSKNDGKISEIDDTYHSLVSSVVSQRMRKRTNSTNNVHDKKVPKFNEEESLGDLSFLTPHHENLKETHTSCEDDEDATVMTVKVSNCAKPFWTVTFPPSAKKKDHRSTSSSPLSLTDQKKKFDRVLKIYRDTLNMKVAEFQDLKAYHSAMITSATKMAKLMIATNQNESAQKYMNIAKQHRLKIRNSTISSSTPSSHSSDSSSNKSSISSSSSSSSSSTESVITTSIRSRISF
jgi:hypothetical protein